ncbi:MAG: division/cell wall cluster transcriptional repressor MraZ [Opitutia bacterium]|jgi:DNA-binding transcriptional regulator/RsmH inhibitor MraZ
MSNSSTHALFTGLHAGKLDEKNRVTIPASWRSDDLERQRYLAVFHPAVGAVIVFPPAMVERIAAAASQVTISDPAKVDALSTLGENSVEVSADKAGRITLNERIVAQANLGRDIAFSGAFTTFQIRGTRPPRPDRDSPQTRAILEALRQLGL